MFSYCPRNARTIQNTIPSSNANNSREPQNVTSESINDKSCSNFYDAYSVNYGLHSGVYPQYPNFRPVITPEGTIRIHLDHYIQVDITVDKAVRVVNVPGRCVAAIAHSGDNSCILHPFGNVLQEGIIINVDLWNRIAKFSNRGITFTSLEHSLVYLVDDSGTKSTVEYFRHLDYDLSSDVFYTNSKCGTEAINSCILEIRNSIHQYQTNGDQMWIIADICIQQNISGDVFVMRDFGRRFIYTSPSLGTLSMSTPFVYVNVGYDPEEHIFVQKGKKNLKSCIRHFKVRNGTQRAGFDRKGKLILN
ncbi:uncharacterized protein [Centruroides vittatus]|uniref:uncharacterized protein n=1 Tax=Centruroides vittatus TaxID=120091 RepID=UPI00350F0A96